MANRRRNAAGLLPAAVEEINRLRTEWAALKNSDLLAEKTCSSSEKPQNTNNKKSSSATLSNEMLRGVVALVEVGSERRALPLRAALSALGASVVPLWNPFVTHVIWGKGGDRKTRAAARASAAHVVSPLWVEACTASGRRLPEKAYPAAPRPSDIPSPLTLLKLLKKAEADSSAAATCLPDSYVTLRRLTKTDEEVGVNKRARRALPRSMSTSEANISSSWSRQDVTSAGRLTRHFSLNDLNTFHFNVVLEGFTRARVQTAPPADSALTPAPLTIPVGEIPLPPDPDTASTSAQPGPLFSGQLGASKRRRRRAMDEPGCSGSSRSRFVPVPAAYPNAVAPGRYVTISTETESEAARVWPRSRAVPVIPPRRPRSPDDDDVRFVGASSQDTVHSADGKIRIVLTGMSREERKRAHMAIRKLRSAHCQSSVNYKTTHVVVGSFGRELVAGDSGPSAPRNRHLSSPLRSRAPPSALRRDEERSQRTLSAIAGAARGCRVVHSTWLYDSEAAKRWVSYRPYAVPELRDTAEKAFLERQAYGMLDKEYAYNVFYGRRVRLSRFVENRGACEELLILCGAVVLDANGAICHNGDLDLDDNEPVEEGGQLPRPIQLRRIGPFPDDRVGPNRSSNDGSRQNADAPENMRAPSPRPALNRVPPRNPVIRASPNAQRLLWRGHDRIRFSEVLIGGLYGQVSSRWVFDSVTHGRMHSVRRYIPIGITQNRVVGAEVEAANTNGVSRF